jgi:hypothetical protein
LLRSPFFPFQRKVRADPAILLQKSFSSFRPLLHVIMHHSASLIPL